jgi:hypothetical protein
MPADGRALDCGGGDRRYGDSRVVNVEFTKSHGVDVLGDALDLPFRDDSFDVILSQAVLEHVVDPPGDREITGLGVADGLDEFAALFPEKPPASIQQVCSTPRRRGRARARIRVARGGGDADLELAGARGRGAPEMWLFNHPIAPWVPADSIAILKLMAVQLQSELPAEVLRARVSLVLPPERVLVVTSADIADALHDAIPEVPRANMLVEPRPLGTAAALAWGAHEVAKRAGPDTVFCALHADLASLTYVVDGAGAGQAHAMATATRMGVATGGPVVGGLVVGVSRMPGLGWAGWVWVWVWVRCCRRVWLMPMVVVGTPRGRVRRGTRAREARCRRALSCRCLFRREPVDIGNVLAQRALQRALVQARGGRGCLGVPCASGASLAASVKTMSGAPGPATRAGGARALAAPASDRKALVRNDDSLAEFD